jgi:aspartate/methionine/tyrosine aminotransferase
LWATKGKNCWKTIEELAQIGVVAVPGDFYGAAGENFVRFSITATDAEIAEAARRLSNALG